MRRSLCLLSLISILAPLGPAAADWLQTHDGALIETKGPWKVKGSQVIFTAVNGTLSSLRVSEVDLDASAVATVDANKAPPPAPEEVEREPVLVLTNKDISRAAGSRRAEVAAGAGQAGAGEASQGQPPAPETPQTLRVVSWRQIENSTIDGLEIVGTLQNLDRNIATDLGATVTLYDENGTSLGSVNAFLGTISLAPRSTTTIRALFPEIYRFAGEPEFAIRHKAIQVRGVVERGPDNES